MKKKESLQTARVDGIETEASFVSLNLYTELLLHKWTARKAMGQQVVREVIGKRMP